jgi:PAS domain S-box-containing protein
MIGGILTIAGITLTSQRDTTPLTFAVSNVIIAWGLFRYRFLDVAPVARGTVVENMRDAVIVLDNQHQVVDINPAGRILLPQANKAVIGMPVTQLFADWSDIVSKYIKAENVSEELMINTDDNRQYFELNISPILGNRSDHLGRVVVLRDITSRKMAEEALQQRTRDLKLSSEVARQVTTQLDLQQLLSQLVEQTRATFDLYFVAVFIYHEDTEQLVLAAGTGEAGRYMLENEISFHIEARPSLVAKAGREKQNVIINDVIIEDAHFYNPNLPDTQSEIVLPMLVGDKLIGVLGFQSEIKNRFTPADMEIFSTLAEQIAIAINNAQLYARQAELAEELLQADEMKSQFLASMSHELRTPLNAIMNFTEMITTGLMGPVNDEQRELLDQSLESSKHLLNLINDVLDISKIQAGKLSLFIENDVNLYTELKTVVGMMEPMLKGRPVKLVQDIDDNLPLLIGDKRRIRQILLNLASNAAKFTDEGSITLSAKNRGDHIQVAVIDCGPGISAEMQEIIFEPFMQTADGVKHAEGTGLGLPITKSLVTAHNGRIWLESEPGEGAAFYVTLPVNGVRS